MKFQHLINTLISCDYIFNSIARALCNVISFIKRRCSCVFEDKIKHGIRASNRAPVI